MGVEVLMALIYQPALSDKQEAGSLYALHVDLFWHTPRIGAANVQVVYKIALL